MVHYLSFQGRCTYWATNIAVKQKERSSLKREICQKNDSPQGEQLLGLDDSGFILFKFCYILLFLSLVDNH